MKRHTGVQVAMLGAGLLGAALFAAGCGSVGGPSLAPDATVRTASLSGRLAGPSGISLEGTPVVAELLIGGRTATLRAIAAPENAARRALLVAAAQNGSLPALPGVYTTTAMADGSFVFRNLPPGEYSVMARRGELVALRTNLQVDGARVASAAVMSFQGTGTISGKVRYPQPNEATPDNSGILTFVKGTSLIAFTQGSSGDYSIRGVPQQGAGASPHIVGTIAGGFADDEIALPQPMTGTTATAPLIVLRPGARLSGRVSDPTIANIDQQGLTNVQIVAATGQSATTGADGFFTLAGLPEGANFLTLRRAGYRTLRQQVGPLVAGVNTFIPITLQRN